MRTTKKILASVLAVCMLASSSVVTGFAAVSDSAETGATNNYIVACQDLDKQYAYDGDLGAIYSPEQTTFKVWSPTATEVTLNRYATGSDEEEGAAKLGTVPMEKLMDGDDWTGVWTATVDGDIVNTYYTYTITSAMPYGGGTQTAETQDVYSVATGVNGRRSMVCDLDSTDPEGWENDAHVVLDKSTQSSVWELHIKDFSYDENSGVSEANRGKYLAFTETGTTLKNEGDIATCIDYLKELGITTVQLNPFYDFQSINEAGSDDQFNWGYDPQNYNVPEGSYSSNPYDGNVRIKECKQMIQALHEAGFSVVMDVVYNHTYSCSAEDSCFQATVPNYYYRLTSAGAFSNGSGCGNEVSSDYAMTRDFIIKSCLYWVNEYHVDGFRFDLMGLIDTETMNLIRDAMDEVDPRLTIWGEGWTGGTSTHASTTCTGAKFYQGTQANAAQVSDRIAFFNDKIRDGIKGSVFDVTERGFIAGNATYAQNINYGVNANTTKKNGWLAAAPSQCVTYAACHDNATLYDQITASATHGEYGVRNDTGVKMSKLAAAIIYSSQGVSFSLAGDEMARTKYGDTNSYKSSPEINKLNWQNIVDYADLVSYYRGMNAIKQAFSPLTAADKSYADAYDFFGRNLDNMSNTVYFTITNDQDGEWNKMAVLFNGSSKSSKLTLGDTSVTDWVIIANDQAAGVTSLGEVKGSVFTVPAYSAVIAVDKQGYEDAAIESNTGKVVVNYVGKNGKELAESVMLQGTIGTGFRTVSSAAVPDIYVLDSVNGNEKGTYSEETQTVTYIYRDYVPESIEKYADVNDDNAVTVDDVTVYQKYLAKIRSLSEEKEATLDFDYDGKNTISDVTMLQKYLAGYTISKGSVEVNYYYTDDNGDLKNLTSSVTISGRVGSDFTTDVYKVMGYKLDESKLPKVTEGKIPYGSKLVVDYYYIPGSLDVTLHLKHNGSETWAPTLWIWGADLAGKDKGNYTGGTWPGKNAEDPDADGWYEYSFTYSGAGSYNVIVSNNSKTQTMDYKGFVENDMWIVIDDAKLSTGDFLTFYTENPDENANAPIATRLY